MKKNIKCLTACLFTILTAVVCMVAASAAASGPDVRVNGRLVAFPDEKPFIQDGRTYIPVRFVAEALGADVSWSHEIQGAVIKKNNMELQLPIGSNIMTVIEDGIVSQVKMDVATMKQNGRTLVPIRFVAEALGAWVSFSNTYNTVQIYDDILTPEEVTALHSLKNHWDVCEERAPLVAGNWAYENLNECMLRDFTSEINYTLKNIYTGETHINLVDSEEEEALFLADFIRYDLAEGYSNKWLGVKATFRTDVSCIAATTVSTGSTYINRGYLTITFSDDADIKEYKSRHTFAKFGNIQPGSTYTYAIESVWMINIARGMPQNMRVFDVTNGAYVQWL